MLDAFIAHLAGMHVPMVEAQCLMQNSTERHCLPPEFGHMHANVSYRQLPAGQTFCAHVVAAGCGYKSD
jgi:hypothetical protein